jgi:hypothetical protein
MDLGFRVLLAFEEFGPRKPIRLCCLSCPDAFLRGISSATRPQSFNVAAASRCGEQSHDLTRSHLICQWTNHLPPYERLALKELDNAHITPKIMSFPRENISPPVLRLEISGSFVTPPSTSTSPGDESSPSFRERARALSNAALPSRRPSQNNISNTTSLLPPRSPLLVPPGMTKARDESQKLLAHVLEQLRHRPKCPSSYPSQADPAAAAKPIALRASASRTTSDAQSLDPDGEDSPGRAFSPDLAFDLMNRLRDVLMISLSQGWQIFGERSVGGL